MRVVVASLACLAVLGIAPAAEAAQRYAAPAGAGPEPCAQAVPCSLNQAIGGAGSGDEVIVAGGEYALSEHAFTSPTAEDVFIHGDFATPAPRVSGSVSGSLVYMNGSGRIAHLLVTNTHEESNAVECRAGGLIERVVGVAEGDRTVGINLKGPCSVRDSVARASGLEAFAVFSSGGQGVASATNVTAIATGSKSSGFVSYLSEGGPGTHLLALRNSIAVGEDSDLRPTEVSGSSGAISASHSNFDRIALSPASLLTDLGGNQTAAPVFVDPLFGDYHQAPGSPTIDAGTRDPLLSALDLDGNPRALGSAPDIGAFEFVPPASPTVAEGRIDSLKLTPSSFRARKRGGAILSARKKRKARVGTTVSYSLSSPAEVSFGVERKLRGRRVGKRCAKPTRANRRKKRCVRFKRLKGTFSHSGSAGANRFKFSGRMRGKALRPGAYRLVGRAGKSVRRAGFRIVR